MTPASPAAPFTNRQPFPFVTWLRRRLMAQWYSRHVQRLELAEIDDHSLRDLGLSREDVRRECAESFWQA